MSIKLLIKTIIAIADVEIIKITRIRPRPPLSITPGRTWNINAKRITKVNNVLEENLINLPLRDAREVFEREYLMSQINRFAGNISKTAIFVGMERSALHRKMKTLSIVSEHKLSKQD